MHLLLYSDFPLHSQWKQASYMIIPNYSELEHKLPHFSQYHNLQALFITGNISQKFILYFINIANH